MKKYFLSLVAMAAMLFATSCQESLVEPQLGGTTTFTVQVPDQMGTKALGSKANVNQLFVAVYADASVANATPIYRDVVAVSAGKATVSLNLIQDQFYDVIFWAQVGDNYVSSEKANNEYTFNLVNIPMEKNYHNTDAGAAFFYYWDDFKPTGTSQPVTLRRPFAQLNLGTTEGSLTNNAGTFTLKSSEIKVKGIADNFNTVSGFGTVTEANKDQVYTFVAVEDSQVSRPLPSDVTIKVADVDYKYVSMDYLPIVGDDQALITVDATITLNNSQSINHKFTNVPVRENYRTNIVGNLISSTTDFNVVVDADFAKDENEQLYPDNDYFVVDNVGAAEYAYGQGKTHVAINYIVNGGKIDIPSTAAETLYLQLPDVNAEFTVNVPQQVKKLNIAVPNTDESNVGLDLIVNAPYSTVDFTGQATMITSTTAPNTLNLNGAEVGTIIVKKGNVVIENESQVEDLVNQSGEEVIVYVDKTSTVEEDIDSDFKKIEEPEKINTLEALQNALTYSTSDVIVVPSGIENTSEFTLKLNGKTVTAVDNSTGSYGLITNKANLTIEGPGTISLTATNNRGWNAYSSVISNNPGGNLTVGKGVVIEHLGGTDMAYGIDNLTNGKGTSAITTINVATVKSTYRAVRQFLNGVEATNELYVNAGATILNTTGTNKGIWMQDPSKNANTGKLVVAEGAHVDDVYLSVTAGSTEWPVEVSIASSSLNQGKTVMSSNVPAGYEVAKVGGVWKVIEYESVSTADELDANLAEGKNVMLTGNLTFSASETSANSGYDGTTGVKVSKGVVLDGQDHNLTVYTTGTWGCAIAATDGIIKNLKVSGAFRGIFMPGANGDVFIDNVTFENVTYTFNSDAGNKNYGVYISNSTLNGWTSFSNAHKEVVFTNCTFGEGSGNAFCRPYNACVFENCEFSTDMEFDTSKVANIVFKNCTYGGVKITAENAASLKTGEVTFFYNGVGSVSFE